MQPLLNYSASNAHKSNRKKKFKLDDSLRTPPCQTPTSYPLVLPPQPSGVLRLSNLMIYFLSLSISNKILVRGGRILFATRVGPSMSFFTPRPHCLMISEVLTKFLSTSLLARICKWKSKVRSCRPQRKLPPLFSHRLHYQACCGYSTSQPIPSHYLSSYFLKKKQEKKIR